MPQCYNDRIYAATETNSVCSKDFGQISSVRMGSLSHSRRKFCEVSTDICVHTTMMEAADRGYHCLLVTDGCVATIPGLHMAEVEMVERKGGIFGATRSTGDVLAALKAME